MNADRLLEVVELLRWQLEKHRVYEPLAKLKGLLENGRSKEAHVAKDEIIAILNKVPSNYLSPSRRAILHEIGGEKLVGQGVGNRLKALLDDYRLSQKEAASIVAAISSEILNFQGFLNQISLGSKSLHLSPHEIADGECEVGVLYPKPEVITDLESLVEEGRNLDNAFRFFMEIGGTSGSPRISHVSSSDFIVFLTVTAGVGAAIVKAIDKILDLIKKGYEVRKVRLEVEEKEIDLEFAKRLKEKEAKIEEEGIEETAKTLIELYEGDEGRRNELRVMAKNAVRFMVVQIKRGVIFEVVGSSKTSNGLAIEEAQKGGGELAGQARHLAEIRRLGGVMRELAARREQLALPEKTADKIGRAGV